MKKIIKIFHKEWNDNIILDIYNKIFYRESTENESGVFEKNNHIIYLKWKNWDEEIFIKNLEDNIYYLCNEIYFHNSEWEDICYIDYKNNIIYRKSENYFGNFILVKNDEKGNEQNEEEYYEVAWEIYNYINTDMEYNDKLLKYKNRINNIIQRLSDAELQADGACEKLQHNNSNNSNNRQKIPNIIHFIFGFKEQTEEFELYRYLSIKSAIDLNKPDKVYFYYNYEPFGFWWNKIKPYLILEKVEPPKQIFGKKIYHYAHQADIIRLQKLIEHGGIYLDIDTITLKPYTDLLVYDFVMGKQYNSDHSIIYGLCNAVILSSKNSSFANKWLDTYKTFRAKGRDIHWDEHSVKKPYELSEMYKNEIKIIDDDCFFYPLWYDIHQLLFTPIDNDKKIDNTNLQNNAYKKIIQNNYCIHLWDTYSNEYLKKLTLDNIFQEHTLYNIFSRKFLKNTISLVFLTYNRFEVTKKCLESYLSTLDIDFIEELIILDNNSNQDFVSYLLEFKNKHSKIRIIFSDENLGVCHGRMVLFREAIGDIIISLDSDAKLLNQHFFHVIRDLLYNERFGIIGISGAFIDKWEFGSQIDIPNEDENEYFADHIAGCCQAFRRDLFHMGFGLDSYYGKFWVEDTDLSMQSLALNKANYRISQKEYIEHEWGGSGKNFKDLFKTNWEYFVNKWKGKILWDIK
jgi:GT2 family glycosyltransferase